MENRAGIPYPSGFYAIIPMSGVYFNKKFGYVLGYVLGSFV